MKLSPLLEYIAMNAVENLQETTIVRGNIKRQYYEEV